MKKWVKWALVGAGALLLVKAVKGGGLGDILKGGSGGALGADAPGVEPGDVTYATYKEKWDQARRHNQEQFSAAGRISRSDSKGKYHWGYFWLTSDGSYVKRVRRPE